MALPERRLISFIYSASVAYVLEFGEYYIRAYYDDVYITSVVTPYTESDLFRIHYKQIGDVMWLVHPKYKPRKLKRTAPDTFELEEIDFKDGPFMTRNDLIDPYDTNPATMACSVTTVGSTGLLTTSAPVFKKGHQGALFQLTHQLTTKIVSASGTTDSGILAFKGNARFITRGTWTGTVYLRRRINGGDWEDFRTYKGSTGAEQNVQFNFTEIEDNVEYYIEATSASSGFRADLSAEDIYHSGVVKVTQYGDASNAICEVISRIESTDATIRWAEGSWSDFRGWPATITFFEDRCVYAGALSASDIETGTEIEYPTLIGLP